MSESRKRKRESSSKCLPDQAFCIKCKKISKIINGAIYVAEFIYKHSESKRSAKRRRVRGLCGVCQSRISRMIKSTEPESTESNSSATSTSDCL